VKRDTGRVGGDDRGAFVGDGECRTLNPEPCMPSFATLVALTLAVWCIGEVAESSGRLRPAQVRWIQVLATATIAWRFGGMWIEQSVLCLALFGALALVERACSVLDQLTARPVRAEAQRPAVAPAAQAAEAATTRVERRGAGIVQHVATVSAFAIEASHRAHRRSSDAGFADREVPRPPSVTPLADRVRSPDEVIEPRRLTPPRPAFEGTIWQ
jgi:hypothetical protein